MAKRKRNPLVTRGHKGQPIRRGVRVAQRMALHTKPGSRRSTQGWALLTRAAGSPTHKRQQRRAGRRSRRNSKGQFS